jgi:hypothetical protein
MDRMTALQTSDFVPLEGPPLRQDSGGVKVLQFVCRAPGIDRDEFRRIWLSESDGDEASNALGLVRHERGAGIPESDGEAAAFDGVRELWWPDVWCFMAARGEAPEAWEQLISGPGIDPAGSGFLVTTEHRVVWPPHG